MSPSWNLPRLVSGRPQSAAKPRLQTLVLETLEDRCLLSGYLQTNLVSDIPGQALYTNKNLHNPWGIAPSPGTGHLRVADNGTGNDALFVDTGKSLNSWNAAVPGPGNQGSGTPTGVVFNPTHNFPVSANGAKAPATFLSVTEDGTIVGWNKNVDRANAIEVVDNSASGTAVYKGLAIANNGQANYLYVANFHAGMVEVYNKVFKPVSLSGNFTDPNLPAGYAPFNILNVGNNLYVAYAVQDANKHDNQNGAGLGLIDVFDANGNFTKRLVTNGGVLNAPWGMAVAPRSGFGPFSGALLVGNFGDGTINAFDPNSGQFQGTLKDQSGNTLSNSGLWGLTFGASEYNDKHTLYFAAGINYEADGLVGAINFKSGGGQAAVHGNDLISALAQNLAHQNSHKSASDLAFANLQTGALSDQELAALAQALMGWS
jgi:uncharacterized protein (TIGR03118 family)